MARWWLQSGRGEPDPAIDARFPTPLQVGVGAVTNFFDTLGIGSFATTTAIFRLKQMVPDRIIPGTLNAGHTLPTVAQAFIYTTIIPVDVLTLVAMITAAVLGAWLGAGVVGEGAPPPLVRRPPRPTEPAGGVTGRLGGGAG